MSEDRNVNVKVLQGRAAGRAVRTAAGRKPRVMTVDQDTAFTAKVSYLRGLVAGRGWKIQSDEKARFMVHIIDQDGKDISGPKTISAAIEFVEKDLQED